MLSKPKARPSFGTKPGGSLPTGRAGNRYRGGAIPMTGSCAERGNLCCDAKGEPGGGGPAKGRVPMRGTGTDGFVVAARPSNSGGAKGPDLPAKEIGQPATGGANV